MSEKCPYCKCQLNPSKKGQHLLNMHEQELLKKTRKLAYNQINIEIYERTFVPINDLREIEQVVLDAIKDMPTIKKKVDHIGVLIAGSASYRLNENFLRNFMSDDLLEIGSEPFYFIMVSFLRNRKAAVLIRLEDFQKAPIDEVKRCIRHEFAHVLCGIELGRTVSHSGYIKGCLSPQEAQQVQITLENIFDDFHADLILVDICPDILLKYLWSIAQENNNATIEKQGLDTLNSRGKTLESAMRAFWCKQNLLVMQKLPKEYHEKEEFKLAQKLFNNRIEWLKPYMTCMVGKRKPIESLTEADFLDQVTFDIRFSQIVGFPGACA